MKYMGRFIVTVTKNDDRCQYEDGSPFNSCTGHEEIKVFTLPLENGGKSKTFLNFDDAVSFMKKEASLSG